jgi:hypothetical protein
VVGRVQIATADQKVTCMGDDHPRGIEELERWVETGLIAGRPDKVNPDAAGPYGGPREPWIRRRSSEGRVHAHTETGATAPGEIDRQKARTIEEQGTDQPDRDRPHESGPDDAYASHHLHNVPRLLGAFNAASLTPQRLSKPRRSTIHQSWAGCKTGLWNAVAW